MTVVKQEPFSIDDFTERLLLDPEFQRQFAWGVMALLILFLLVTSISFIFYFAYTYSPKKRFMQHENPDFYDKMKFKIEKACFEVRIPGEPRGTDVGGPNLDDASVYDRIQQ